MDQSLQIDLTGSEQYDTVPRWVHLTQLEESGMDKTASMYDISQMVARARSGVSAITYKKDKCAANIISNSRVDVAITFFAWPSTHDLNYTLESNIGNISPATIVDEFTEFSVIFKKTSVVELDFILTDIYSVIWETPCYSVTGERLDQKEVTLDGLTTLRVDQPIFGVVRVKGKKIGARHTVIASIIKSIPERPDEPIPDEGITLSDLSTYWGYTDLATWDGEATDPEEQADMTGLSVDNLSITIIAKWINKNGEEATESMRLEIPQCVRDLLAFCGDNLEDALNSKNSENLIICNKSYEETHLNVYVSGCTGKVLEERESKRDPDSWCG